MKTSKLSIYSEQTQRENKDLNNIISNKKESLSTQISRTENSNSNKDINKNKIHLKLPLQENNSYRKNINKLSFEPTLKISRTKDFFQKLKNHYTEELNIDSMQKVNLQNFKRPIKINIQNININNYHYYKYPFSKKILNNESESEIFPLITSTCPNIEINNNKNNNIQYNKIINYNHIITQSNNISPLQNIQFNENYFRKKYRKVKLVDLKKIKSLKNENNNDEINPESIKIKKKDCFSNRINNNPIIIKEKNYEKKDLNEKIDVIENNIYNDDDNSFIDELKDLLIDVDEKGCIKIKKEINKNNNNIINNNNNNSFNENGFNNNNFNDRNLNENFTDNNKYEKEENYNTNDLLNKSFDLKDEEEEEENEKEKIPQIKNNLIRPPTSYGGIIARKKSIQQTLKGKNSKN